MAGRSNPLKEYRAKRDFTRTPEPSPKSSSRRAREARFVIQKHDATRLHYDFRLEADGVLKSWAVPKGPSTDPGDKRLAMRTEDHPLDYLKFEGAIPEGEYGAGPVIVWDLGTYENRTLDRKGRSLPVSQGIDQGKVEVFLRGRKLSGIFLLVRTNNRGGRESWLLFKKRDEHATRGSTILDDRPESVLSGHTIEQVGQRPRKASSRPRKRSPARDGQSAAKNQPQPDWIDPMLATLIEPEWFNRVANDAPWLYEQKLDGFRALAFRKADQVRLLSRNRLDLGSRFPEIVDALRRQPVEEFIVDGEIVALVGRRASFEKLQQRLKPVTLEQARRSGVRLAYFVFDLLFVNGFDTRRLPLVQRKTLLKKAIDFDGRLLRFTAHQTGDALAALEDVCSKGWEGLIAKRADSTYQSRRGKDWLKLKCVNRQEFAIGGYTDPKGSRAAFGALLVGYSDERGRFQYAGRVGTGFSDELLRSLHQRLQKHAVEKSPFVPDPELPKRGVHWVKPKLVAEIGFFEWTQDGKLRHPRFLGLRPERRAEEVRRERPLKSP